MAQIEENEQTYACDDPEPVQRGATPSASTCSLPISEEPTDSDSTEDESQEHPEEIEEPPAIQLAADDAPAHQTESPGTSDLPPFDEQRYQFWRLLNPAVRSGGQIELYLDRLTGATVAAKRVPARRLQAFSSTNLEDLENPWQEMAVATDLGRPGRGRVPGVCACHGAFRSTSGDAMLVSDYLPGGDLFDVASDLGEPGPWREQQAWPLIRSLLEAIMTIHSRGVAHGDVSLENMLRQRGCSMSIALVDFGMAVTGDLTKVIGVRGKPSYQAPEMHTERVYDARCADLFACGVAAYALAIGSYPWSSTRPGSCLAFGYAQKHGIEAFFQRRKVSVGGVRRPLSCFLSVRYKQLLLTLLSLEPLRRLEVSAWRFMHGGFAAEFEATMGVPEALAGG